MIASVPFALLIALSPCRAQSDLTLKLKELLTLPRTSSRQATRSPRAYLNEGVAAFLGTLWIEANWTHRCDRKSQRRPPCSHPVGTLHPWRERRGRPAARHQPRLLPNQSDVRSLDAPRHCRRQGPAKRVAVLLYAAQDTKPDYFEHLLEKASGKDLRWFFDDSGQPRPRLARTPHSVGAPPSREAHQTVLVSIEKSSTTATPKRKFPSP